MKVVYRKGDPLPGSDIPINDPGLLRLAMALVKLVREEPVIKKISTRKRPSKQSA